MSYGKLIGGKLFDAPNVLNKDGKQYINPPEWLYLECGFLPLEYTTIPDMKEGYHLVQSWMIMDGHLIQKWNYEADVETSILIKRLNELEEKVGELTYSLKQISENITEIEKKEDEEMPLGDYLNPILITEAGITTVAGLWYYVDDKALPHEAIVDAFVMPEDFNDKTWFDFV